MENKTLATGAGVVLSAAAILSGCTLPNSRDYTAHQVESGASLDQLYGKVTGVEIEESAAINGTAKYCLKVKVAMPVEVVEMEDAETTFRSRSNAKMKQTLKNYGGHLLRTQEQKQKLDELFAEAEGETVVYGARKEKKIGAEEIVVHIHMKDKKDAAIWSGYLDGKEIAFKLENMKYTSDVEIENIDGDTVVSLRGNPQDYIRWRDTTDAAVLGTMFEGYTDAHPMGEQSLLERMHDQVDALRTEDLIKAAEATKEEAEPEQKEEDKAFQKRKISPIQKDGKEGPYRTLRGKVITPAESDVGN
jgi:hypothetical protein